MRIVFFTETYLPQLNGVTYTLDSWKKTLQEQGHEVTIVYPDSGHAPGQGELPVPAVTSRVVDGYRAGLPLLSQVNAVLPDPDIVHTHGPFGMGVLAMRYARRNNVPLVASHHTPGEHYFDYLTGSKHAHHLLDTMYRFWQHRFYPRCDQVYAPTQDAADRLQQRVGITVDTLSNGVDTRFFQPQSSDFRERHGINAGPVAGFCGRLGYEKNLEDLLAFADRFDGQVVVAGDGFARDWYEPRFADAGITYLGRLPRQEMPLFYSALDVFVMPSTVETQGVSVLEANACGTPVVGADRLALQNTIDGRNGKRYAPGNVDDLVDAVAEIVGDRDRYSAGALQVAEEHSVARSMEELVSGYRDLSRAA